MSEKEKFDENKEIQRILLYYGINIPIEEIEKIELLEKTKSKITYWNKKTNEIITSDLMGSIYKKYKANYSISLTTSNLDKSFFIEQFNYIEQPKTYQEAGQNALKSRNNNETKILSRAYIDISTKYGNFCLHIEEGYKDCLIGPYRQVSLYYGNHEQVIEKYNNDFDFKNCCLFRWKYIKYNKFNQCTMGYNNNSYYNPNISIWSYGESIYDDKEVDIPFYAFESRENRNSGIILINGELRLEENRKCIPDIFKSSEIEKQIEEYENRNNLSKAYFVNYDECFTIVKQDNTIIIEYKKKDNKTRKWDKSFSTSITSSTNKEFSNDDFQQIITLMDTFPISKELQIFIKSQLTGYSNIHDKNNFSKINKFSLEHYNFESMLEYIKQENISEIVENGLELLSNTFDIPIEILLGHNAPNQLKNTQHMLEKTKQQNS